MSPRHWAPSSYNEQSWCFIIATKEQPQEFQKLWSCLVPANQEWAKEESGVSHLTFDFNDKDNKAVIHDLGAAVSHLSLEATARAISVHQIIGIEPERARKTYNIPDDYEVLTGFAIGYVNLNKNFQTYLQKETKLHVLERTFQNLYSTRIWKLPLYKLFT